MTLPTGTITMAQVAAELGRPLAGVNLNDGLVRLLAGRPSGAISMSDLQGKSGGVNGSFAVFNGGSIAGININQPYWGVTMNGANQYGAGANINIGFSAVPGYTGNIRITNNTTGASAILSQLPAPNDKIWSVGAADSNILWNRQGATDSFSIVPA
jgi:hypothetical protein